MDIRDAGRCPGSGTTNRLAVPDLLALDLGSLGETEREMRRSHASEFSAGRGSEPSTYTGRTPPVEPRARLARGVGRRPVI
ncbi:hypothetical protein EAH80_29375 [Mycobacterium hodleri]|uniref:Uncharacterized protein n=1 Tax=Mycolicibacterium hodleri TaxID=49897 RepID=A0A502DPM2_9MYCO|nr:hypothetical protein EAH80_29375 [Mycolicibacterium hodleri]